MGNRRFTKFLVDNDLYHKFIKNRKYCINRNYSMQTVPEEDLLKLAFYWEKTDEGYQFWSECDKKWIKYLYNCE